MAPTVAIVKPQQRAIQRVIEQPGSIEAYEETALVSKITGYVQTISDDPDRQDRPPGERQVDIGSRVKKGQVLAMLAVPELDKEFAQKAALLKQANTEVVQADKALTAAKEGVDAAVAAVAEAQAGLSRAEGLYTRWDLELKRITELARDGVIALGTRDETRNQFKSAEAAWNETKARVTASQAAVRKAEADREKAAADLETARARVEVARANLEQIDALRGYMTIRSPFDGIVTHRQANTGSLVSAAEKIPLFQVARIDPVRVAVIVPELDAGLVNNGQEVHINMQTSPVSFAAGKVTRASWSLAPGSRTLRTEVDLPNKNAVFRPGTYVLARLTVDLPKDWTVPAAAVGKVGDEAVMHLVEAGIAVRVSVQLGLGDARMTQIRAYKKPGESTWIPVTGAEEIATPASAVTNGQSVSPAP